MCVCVYVCMHCRFSQSTVADERVLITAASIWWSGEFVFVPSSAGREFVAAVGSLLSEWLEMARKKTFLRTLHSWYNWCSSYLFCRTDLIGWGPVKDFFQQVVWHARIRNCMMCLRNCNFLLVHWVQLAFLSRKCWLEQKTFIWCRKEAVMQVQNSDFMHKSHISWWNFSIVNVHSGRRPRYLYLYFHCWPPQFLRTSLLARGVAGVNMR